MRYTFVLRILSVLLFSFFPGFFGFVCFFGGGSIAPTPPISSVAEKDLKELDKEVSKFCKSKQTFDRLVVTKEEALDLFDYNAFKK